MFDNITEKVIEDILSVDRSILAGILSVNQSDLSPIARQKKFDSRRILDLLYLYQNELLLIELKAVPFYSEIIEQINDNGIGIIEEKVNDPNSFGLKAIRERVQIYNGNIIIRGFVGKGTKVIVNIPFKK